MGSKTSRQRKEVKPMHQDWSLAGMEDHLSEIADLAVVSEAVPQYLKVMALSLHTLATIESIKLKSDGRSLMAYEQKTINDQKATVEDRIKATEAIIQNSREWVL